MPTRERLDGLVAAVVAGSFVEAVREHYHHHAAMREHSDLERRSLSTLIALEEVALRSFSVRPYPPERVLVDGDDVAICWKLDFTDSDEVTRRMEEVALQRWRGDWIATERFFYDTNLPTIEQGCWNEIGLPRCGNPAVAGDYRIGRPADHRRRGVTRLRRCAVPR